MGVWQAGPQLATVNLYVEFSLCTFWLGTSIFLQRSVLLQRVAFRSATLGEKQLACAARHQRGYLPLMVEFNQWSAASKKILDPMSFIHKFAANET